MKNLEVSMKNKISLLIMCLLFCSSVNSQTKFAVDSLRINEYIVIINAAGDTVFVSDATLARFHESLSYPKRFSMPPVAWLPVAENMIDTLNVSSVDHEEIILLAEGDSTAKSMTNSEFLPPDFQSADSLWIYALCASTAADSTELIFRKRIYDIPFTSSILDATQDGYVDPDTLGWRMTATANDIEKLVLTNITDGTESSTFGANKWAQFQIERANPASDPEIAVVSILGVILFYH
jgi:hypothetical protein